MRHYRFKDLGEIESQYLNILEKEIIIRILSHFIGVKMHFIIERA